MKAQLAIIVVACLVCSQAIARDYVLTIDGKQYEVDIGKQAIIKLPDGRNIRVTLDKKAFGSFKSENFSFDYPSKLSPSRAELGDGVFQTLMISPHTTMVIIQEYTTMNPCGLIDMTLNEMIKEEGDITKSPSTRRLSSGAQLNGKMAVSKYGGDEYTRHVLCCEARDVHIIIVTMIKKAAPQEDLTMLETFWKSLEISMK